ERIVLRGLAHVHAIAAHDLPDQEILPRPPRPARGDAYDARERALRQQILKEGGWRHGAECSESRCSILRSSLHFMRSSVNAKIKKQPRSSLPRTAALRLHFQMARMTSELATIVDHIRYAASRFNAAGLTFGHS